MKNKNEFNERQHNEGKSEKQKKKEKNFWIKLTVNAVISAETSKYNDPASKHSKKKGKYLLRCGT